MTNIRYTTLSELEGQDFFFIDELPMEHHADFMLKNQCIAEVNGHRIYTLRDVQTYAETRGMVWNYERVEFPKLNYQLTHPEVED